MRVLVVDDDAVIRELVSLILEQAGCVVLTADDGRSALDGLSGNPVDLILLDHVMPDVDGPAFLAAYRNHCPAPRAPVVLMTALRQSSGSLPSDEDVISVIAKPFDIDDLLAIVHDAARAIDADVAVRG
ncbi:MAG: response regulator [Chloroflexi bacterium]|nr:response regulator [Chloroflexota bacterium]